MIYAKKVKHSINPLTGVGPATFLLEYPLEIHAELMTHRVFSRNAASGRAIPILSVIGQAKNNTVMPIWTQNESGMQGNRVTDITTINAANSILADLLDATVNAVEALQELGIHKQNVNRYLNAFTHIRVIVTSVEWLNWFDLRYDEAAKPEIYELAKAMAAEFYMVPPTVLAEGDWHTPFAPQGLSVTDRKIISTSMCAQVSYRKEDATLEKALILHDRLIHGGKLHASPFEHVCRVLGPNETPKGNLPGFFQYRTEIENKLYAEKIHEPEEPTAVSGGMAGARHLRSRPETEQHLGNVPDQKCPGYYTK